MNYTEYLNDIPAHFYSFSNDTLNGIRKIVFSENTTRVERLENLDAYSQTRRDEINRLFEHIESNMNNDGLEKNDFDMLLFLLNSLYSSLARFLNQHFDAGFATINSQ